MRLTEYAAELGYDAALVRTPHFYKKSMQPANLLAFYRTVADRSPLPVLIYNVPPFTGYDMPAELVIELAGHSNIIGTLRHLAKISDGDARKALNSLEIAALTTAPAPTESSTSTSPSPSKASRKRPWCMTAMATRITTRFPRSSNPCAAATRTPRFTGWRR